MYERAYTSPPSRVTFAKRSRAKPPHGWSARTSRGTPQARAAMPTRPTPSALARRTMPVFSSRDSTDAVEKNVSAIRSTSGRTSSRLRRIVPRSSVAQVAADAAGLHPAPAEAAAAGGQRGVDHPGAQGAEHGVAGQVGHVVGDGRQVADVDGDPLQLQGDVPDEGRPRRDLQPEQRLHGAGVGQAVPDGGVAGDGLGQPVPQGMGRRGRRFPSAARRPGAGSRAGSPGGGRPRRCTGTGSAPAR